LTSILFSIFAAAKNFRDVLVVVDPADYPRVLDELARPGGPSLEFRFELMKKTFAHTAQYDGTIAMTLAAVDIDGGTIAPYTEVIVVDYQPPRLVLVTPLDQEI